MLNFSPMFTANEMRLSNKVYKVQFKPREESIKVKVNASSWIRLLLSFSWRKFWIRWAPCERPKIGWVINFYIYI